jgi:hypothetical protein
MFAAGRSDRRDRDRADGRNGAAKPVLAINE